MSLREPGRNLQIQSTAPLRYLHVATGMISAVESPLDRLARPKHKRPRKAENNRKQEQPQKGKETTSTEQPHA